MNIKYLLSASIVTFATFASMQAHAHAKLESSLPQAGALLSEAPKEVRLRFNEGLEAAFSKIKLLDTKNIEVPLAKVEVDNSNPKAMTATLPPLTAGEYKVQWSTMTHDGHKTKGEYTFKVK